MQTLILKRQLAFMDDEPRVVLARRNRIENLVERDDFEGKTAGQQEPQGQKRCGSGFQGRAIFALANFSRVKGSRATTMGP